MPVTPEQQKAVWAVPEADLSDGAKAVWQAMADYAEAYNSSDAAAVISQEMGGSISEAEVQAALNELGSKGYLSYNSFEAKYPESLPPV